MECRDVRTKVGSRLWGGREVVDVVGVDEASTLTLTLTSTISLKTSRTFWGARDLGGPIPV